jgi:hypothetical protein
MTALNSKPIAIDADVSGERWTLGDIDELAKIIAMVTIGQADHAATIVRKLKPQQPIISMQQLYAQARNQMNLAGKRPQARFHRDGFLFECISWIAAQQNASRRTYLKVPHIKATTQGMDGLMIELHSKKPLVVNSTIFEDKCTENPRNKFKSEVLKTFSEHHRHERSADLLSTAISLIKESGMNGSHATRAAERVLDVAYRTYRAALTVDSTFNTAAKRSSLFKDYTDLDRITQQQRVGATFVVKTPLRDWFDLLATRVVLALNQFETDYV